MKEREYQLMMMYYSAKAADPYYSWDAAYEVTVDSTNSLTSGIQLMNILEYTVDWGDGEVKEENLTSSQTKTIWHVYTQAGTYTVKLRGRRNGLGIWFNIPQNYKTAPTAVLKVNPTELQPWNQNSNTRMLWYGCTKLKSAKLHKRMKTIPTNCFRECEILETVEWPEALEEIGEYAFYKCAKLDFDSLPETMKRIQSSAFQQCTSLKSLKTLPAGIDTIGGSAFSGCSSLALTALPDGLTSIGTYAFNGCSKITLTALPDGLKELQSQVFTNCYNFRNFRIGENVTSISDTFRSCNSIKNVLFLGTPTYIHGAAFTGNDNLRDVYVPWSEGEVANAPWGSTNWTIHFNNNHVLSSYTSPTSFITTSEGVCDLADNVFEEQTEATFAVMPGVLRKVGEYAFKNCTKLEKVVFQNRPDTLPENIFEGCTALKDVYVPWSESELEVKGTTATIHYDSELVVPKNKHNNSTAETSFELSESLVEIDNYAFNNCTSLTTVNLSDTIKRIGNYAFYNCKVLKLAKLPDALTFIGWNAFQNCSSLALTALPSGVTSIGTYAFQGCSSLALTALPAGVTSIGTYAFNGCSKITLTALPEGVTSIGSDAFHGCSSLALEALPAGVTSIGGRAFYNCKKCSFSVIPDSVITIGADAFDYIEGTTTLTIGSNVQTIGTDAFYRLPNLTTVTFKGTPSQIGTGAFNCLALTDIYVPWAEGAVANAPWGASNATIHYNTAVTE